MNPSYLNLKFWQQLRNTFSIPEFLSPPKMKIVVTCEKKFIFKDFSQVFSVKGKVVTWCKILLLMLRAEVKVKKLWISLPMSELLKGQLKVKHYNIENTFLILYHKSELKQVHQKLFFWNFCTLTFEV